jgi:all-trans-nonaprenyl-diphosphate synthase
MNISQTSLGQPIVPSYELAQLLEPVQTELELVEEWLRSNLVDNSPFISELLNQVFKAGGKRIRPALCLLSAKATHSGTGDISRLQIILAVLTELIHTASLVHDDVIDGSTTRRGQETINRKWNDKLAVLIGDLLFAQASVCLSRLMNPEVVGIFGQVIGDLCAGEIRQMRQQFIATLELDSYIQKSIWKTASLFAGGCHSAPILNHCSQTVIGSLKEYGLALGICFQIVDDLLDITGDANQLGKPAGRDLAHGIVTAPALFVLQQKSSASQKLHELIQTRAVCTSDGIAEALNIVRQNGGVEATISLARQYADKAHKSLSILPPSNYKDSLDNLVEWLFARTN